MYVQNDSVSHRAKTLRRFNDVVSYLIVTLNLQSTIVMNANLQSVNLQKSNIFVCLSWQAALTSVFIAIKMAQPFYFRWLVCPENASNFMYTCITIVKSL